MNTNIINENWQCGRLERDKAEALYQQKESMNRAFRVQLSKLVKEKEELLRKYQQVSIYFWNKYIYKYINQFWNNKLLLAEWSALLTTKQMYSGSIPAEVITFFGGITNFEH